MSGIRISAVLVVTSWLMLSAGCESDEAAKKPALKGDVEILGSGTAALLVAPIADAFTKEHGAVTFDLKESSSAWGIGYVRQGMTDIAMSIRPPLPSESELVARPIARDGLCILVHKDNPVEALTDEQVAGIFTGKIKNWNEVGGGDAEIVRINHADVRTSLALFVTYLKLETGDIKYTDIVISSDNEALTHVSAKPDAITYGSIAAARTGIGGGKTVKLIGFGGVEPTVENVASGKVPITYDVMLVTKGAPDEVAKAFIDYASSEAVTEIRKKKNFAPAATGAQPQAPPA